MGSAPFLFLGCWPHAMLFPVSVYLVILSYLTNAPLPLSFVYILLCGAFIVLVLVFLSGLSSTAHHMVASLA